LGDSHYWLARLHGLRGDLAEERAAWVRYIKHWNDDTHWDRLDEACDRYLELQLMSHAV
jgi:hypothetical protein